MYRRSLNVATVAGAVLLLSACAHNAPPVPAPDQPSQAEFGMGEAKEADSSVDPAIKGAGTGDMKSDGAYFVGSGKFVNANAKGRASGADVGPDGITLNFVDADIAKVAEAVLGGH